MKSKGANKTFLKSGSLKNFRSFSDCQIDLHPSLNVLVAENGGGKTSILDGLAIGLGAAVNAIAQHTISSGFEKSDTKRIRQGRIMMPVLPTVVHISGCVFQGDLTWSRSIKNIAKKSRTSTKDSSDLNEYIEAVDKKELPVFAYYGTGRLWSEHKFTGKRPIRMSENSERLQGYLNCLSSSSSFKDTMNWFAQRNNEIKDTRFKTVIQKNIKLITAVREAVNIVLTPVGWESLDWDYDLQTMVVSHKEHGTLPIDSLSDGIQNTIGLVADLARRCAVLNAQMEEKSSKETCGVVLIDEVDMHLHPTWQQRIVILLQKAFPKIQFIVTTHSPQVLTTVYKESVKIIRSNGSIESPGFQTRGVESPEVLARIMNVNPIPEVREAIDVRDYRTLIEDGKGTSISAKLLREKLIKHFGESHPVIDECDNLMRFQQFKIKGKAT